MIGILISPITKEFLKGDKVDVALKKNAQNDKNENQIFKTDSMTVARLRSYIAATRQWKKEYPCQSASPEFARKSISLAQAESLKSMITSDIKN